MRINHNISALNTYRQLSTNNTATKGSLQKLSSGLRINSAADDAAGLAISEKMRGQIRGLDQASSNANDGISLIQTAEGALNETHSILQRMRELAVQAANDTNTNNDRIEIQKEIDQLTSEITRISTDTQFNTMNLLDGSMQANVIGNTAPAGTSISVAAGATLETGSYDVTISAYKPEIPATPGSTVTAIADPSATAATYTYHRAGVNNGAGGTYATDGWYSSPTATGLTDVPGLTISGVAQENTKIEVSPPSADGTPAIATEADNLSGSASVTFTQSDALEGLDSPLLQPVAHGVTPTEVPIKFTKAGTGSWTSDVGGFSAASDADMADFGVVINNEGDIQPGDTITIRVTPAVNPSTLAKATVENVNAIKYEAASYEAEITFAAAGGNVKVSDASFNYEFPADFPVHPAVTQFSVDVDASKALTFHIGANSGQNTKLNMNELDAKSLKIDKLDLTSQQGADAAIRVIDNAITTVSAQRAALGAMQNRLEHSINNLSTTSENLSASESQIRDVDMAKEMMEYTKNNILSQAAQSMLAQANQQPQQILQLLQG